MRKIKTIQLLFISALVTVLLFTGMAAAQDFRVYNEEDFRNAITQINGEVPGGSHTILVYEDFNLTYFTEAEHDKYHPGSRGHILSLDYTYSGVLTIKSASAVSYTIRSNMDYNTFEPYNYSYSSNSYHPYSFFNISGNDTTVIFENIIFDGLGINLGNSSSATPSNNSTVRNAQVINCTYSGIRVWYANNSTLDNVSVSYCSQGVGGGVYVWYSKGLTIKDSDIVNNTAVGVQVGGQNLPNVAGRPHGGGIYMLESIVDICGDTNITGNLVDGYQSTPMGGGIYAERTNLRIFGNTNISDNNVPGNAGVTQTYGGGIAVNNGRVTFLTEKNVEISENTVISNNSADIGGGIYAQKFSNHIGMALQISDDVIIRQNEAVYGGGISSSLPVLLQNNTTLIENVALRDGGGIYLSATSGPTISVSGDTDQTVSFLQNVAARNGGAVFISGLDTLLSNYELFEKTEFTNLRFSENLALKCYLWNLTDSELETNMTYIKNNLPVMENTEFTAPFTNAYNNADIVFINEGEVIVPVFIDYFADSLETEILNSVYSLSPEGAELNESSLESFFGADWLNLYQPSGYEAGQLQETLPLTISGGLVLNVLYLKETDDVSTGGGSGTGSAVVSDSADETESSAPESLAPESSAPPDSQLPAYTEESEVVILLFAIAIACYLFVAKNNLGSDY